MTNIISLVCEACGGKLEYKDNDTLICHYCGTEFIMSEPTENFTIVAGTLEKYTGRSTVVIVPDCVVTIGECAFQNLMNVNSVILPSSVKRIESRAFEGCANLEEIEIPASVNYIGDCAFKNSGLTQLVIKGRLTYIGNEAFMQCNKLKAITMMDAFDKSGLKVFKQCTQLEIANMNLKVFSGSMKPSMEVKKHGDTRPTFFDFFQGTPLYNTLDRKYKTRQCVYCNGTIGQKGFCSKCGEQHYDLTGGCYIATAVYGSYDCPQVWTLRRFRDNILSKTWYGRTFIKMYYAVSPTFVKWFGHTEWFKKMWQYRLDRMVAKLQANGVESTRYEDKNW